MIRLKTLGSILQDTVFSLCERELRVDFLEIAAFHNTFMAQFNAVSYIDQNYNLALVNPHQFVDEYQETIDAYLQNQGLRCNRLLLQKKYMFFILINEKRFYNLYESHYMQLFNSLDISLTKDHNIIQQKVLQVIQKLKETEVH